MLTLGRRSLLAWSISLALLAGLSACGSSASSSSGNGSGTSGAQFQARLNLAKCFRSHGVNVPDPSTGGGPAGGGGIFRSLRNYPQAQIQSARTACRQYISQAFPRLNLSPAQRAQFQQQAVKFAQCMRSHGIDIPDPTSNGGGGSGFGRALRSVDRNSPAFKTASTTCASLRPRLGRRGAGGAGGGRAGAGGGPGA
ncbi:MAG: hypothetical protein ACR2IP_14345 [Solirubrobacteraceae bacterium]